MSTAMERARGVLTASINSKKGMFCVFFLFILFSFVYLSANQEVTSAPAVSVFMPSYSYVAPSSPSYLALQSLSLNSTYVSGGNCNCNNNNSGSSRSIGYDPWKPPFMDACSAFSASRGDDQRVVSFSLYGELTSKYFTGVKRRLEEIKVFYPGYVMRLYHNLREGKDTGMEQLCHLFCQEPHLDLCDVTDIGLLGNVSGHFGMLWRFAPLADPLVSEWHSRDLDSNIFSREEAAVKDWKDHSNATFHIMRDHPWHNVAILGGMFGMRNHRWSMLKRKRLWEDLLTEGKGVWRQGLDQDLLSLLLFPTASVDMVAHDSYTCNGLPSPLNRPFPTKRESSEDFITSKGRNFVGSDWDTRTINLKEVGECPIQCRPKDHQDWKLC